MPVADAPAADNTVTLRRYFTPLLRRHDTLRY